MQNPLIQQAQELEQQIKNLIADSDPDNGDATEDLKDNIKEAFLGTLGRTDAHKGKFDELVTEAAEYIDVKGVVVKATPHQVIIELPKKFDTDPVVIRPVDLDSDE